MIRGEKSKGKKSDGEVLLVRGGTKKYPAQRKVEGSKSIKKVGG